MTHGKIVTRGSLEFEQAIQGARDALEKAVYQTAKKELSEALVDLSRRPEPDVTGTIQHCMAALEATAKTLSNDPKATLGEIINREAAKLSIPPPLDTAIQKIWGYASEMGRHLREGRTPTEYRII